MNESALFVLLLCVTESLTSGLQDESIADLVRKEVSKQLREITEKSIQEEKTIRKLELTIHELQETVKTLKSSCNCRDYDRKADIQNKPEHRSDITGNNLNEMSSVDKTDTSLSEKRIRKPEKGEEIQHKKRLLENNISDGQMVAFYAWMNNSEANPGSHHIIVFDGVQSSLGSAYDRHTGIFRTPTTGHFVFSWTIISESHGWIYSELVVNSTPFGHLLTNSQDITDDHTATGLVVLSLKQGDDVYIRTSTQPGHGRILSSQYYRSSFSGWRIA